VWREALRSRRTPPDPLHLLPDRRSLESRKPDKQIPYALILSRRAGHPRSACSAQRLERGKVQSELYRRTRLPPPQSLNRFRDSATQTSRFADRPMSEPVLSGPAGAMSGPALAWPGGIDSFGCGETARPALQHEGLFVGHAPDGGQQRVHGAMLRDGPQVGKASFHGRRRDVAAGDPNEEIIGGRWCWAYGVPGVRGRRRRRSYSGSTPCRLPIARALWRRLAPAEIDTHPQIFCSSAAWFEVPRFSRSWASV
jgi:hypothetical protein